MIFLLTAHRRTGVAFFPTDRPARTFKAMVTDLDRVAVSQRCDPFPGQEISSVGLARFIDQKDQPRGFDLVMRYRVSRRKFRRGATIPADGIRPAVQVERGTVGAKVSLISKQAVISTYRYSPARGSRWGNGGISPSRQII
ncbi:MAG: hypothetical protein CM15mP74_10980 [Halieaceae bacterium]|nr:MAG: hypothetical protein CM15mP74_10980 [Halieaceae bacterium]